MYGSESTDSRYIRSWALHNQFLYYLRLKDDLDVKIQKSGYAQGFENSLDVSIFWYTQNYLIVHVLLHWYPSGTIDIVFYVDVGGGIFASFLLSRYVPACIHVLLYVYFLLFVRPIIELKRVTFLYTWNSAGDLKSLGSKVASFEGVIIVFYPRTFMVLLLYRSYMMAFNTGVQIASMNYVARRLNNKL